MSPLSPAVRLRPRARALVLLVLLAPAILLLPIVGARGLMAQERAVDAPRTHVRVPEAVGARAIVRTTGGRDTLTQRAALARALGAARRQERSGQAMVLAGAVGIVGSSAAWIRQGRMGMTGGQAAIFAGSTGIAFAGAARWTAARTRAQRTRATLARAEATGR